MGYRPINIQLLVKGSKDAKPAPLSTLPNYNPRTVVRGYIYDMEEYLNKNVENYLKLTGGTRGKLRAAETPFIDENRLPLGCEGDDTESALARANLKKPVWSWSIGSVHDVFPVVLLYQ